MMAQVLKSQRMIYFVNLIVVELWWLIMLGVYNNKWLAAS